MKSTGENVLGACTKSDCPNNGSGLPTESATICSNSVSGLVGICGRQICEGFSGGRVGVYWSGVNPYGVFKVGVRMVEEGNSPDGAVFPLWPCAPLQVGLSAIEGSEQSIDP
jgi:hypothetical protein